MTTPNASGSPFTAEYTGQFGVDQVVTPPTVTIASLKAQLHQTQDFLAAGAGHQPQLQKARNMLALISQNLSKLGTSS